jgi:PIN domain nuclease of toxin-antitoxin system
MILLDTHALLWMDRNDGALGKDARLVIEQAWRKGAVGVSAISFWESALLAQRGRIALPVPVEIWRADLLGAGVIEIAIDGGIALLATQLDNLHRDPADRFIIATALRNAALLVTADANILEWPAALKRQNART